MWRRAYKLKPSCQHRIGPNSDLFQSSYSFFEFCCLGIGDQPQDESTKSRTHGPYSETPGKAFPEMARDPSDATLGWISVTQKVLWTQRRAVGVLPCALKGEEYY